MDLNDIRTGNADTWTYVGLGVDLVCLALPGATGGRLAVTAVEEGVNHADNVGDLFKFLDKTEDITSATNKVDNLYDAARSTEGLADGITILKSPDKTDQVRRTLGYDGKKIQINTGHGYGREHATGSVQNIGTINEIESEIVLDINSAVNSNVAIPNTGYIERMVTVNNQQVGYRLSQTQDGTYRVGTYYPK
jgi:hypothetical protein